MVAFLPANPGAGTCAAIKRERASRTGPHFNPEEIQAVLGVEVIVEVGVMCVGADLYLSDVIAKSRSAIDWQDIFHSFR
jgi:hypothetical protein